MQHRDNAAQAFRPDRRILLLLRQRAIDAAGADIIDQFDRRGLGVAPVDLIDTPMSAFGPSKRRASCAAMSSGPRCTPSASAASATSTRSLTTNGTPNGASACFDRSRRRDHVARFAFLVAQLNERGAALGAQPRQFRQIAAAGALGIDNGIETKIDRHNGITP